MGERRTAQHDRLRPRHPVSRARAPRRAPPLTEKEWETHLFRQVAKPPAPGPRGSAHQRPAGCPLSGPLPMSAVGAKQPLRVRRPSTARCHRARSFLCYGRTKMPYSS
jgi:hypothetical protein